MTTEGGFESAIGMNLRLGMAVDARKELVPQIPIPPNAILTEDGADVLSEDGQYVIDEGA